MCAASLTLGCLSDSHGVGSGGDDVPEGACNAVTKSATGLTQHHLDDCAPIDYPDNPPIGGDHYGTWAAFQSYAFPVRAASSCTTWSTARLSLPTTAPTAATTRWPKFMR